MSNARTMAPTSQLAGSSVQSALRLPAQQAKALRCNICTIARRCGCPSTRKPAAAPWEDSFIVLEIWIHWPRWTRGRGADPGPDERSGPPEEGSTIPGGIGEGGTAPQLRCPAFIPSFHRFTNPFSTWSQHFQISGTATSLRHCTDTIVVKTEIWCRAAAPAKQSCPCEQILTFDLCE